MHAGSDPRVTSEQWWINHIPRQTQAGQFCWRKQGFAELDHVLWWGHIPPLCSSPACTSHDQKQAGTWTLATTKPLNSTSTKRQFSAELHSAPHTQLFVLHHDPGIVSPPGDRNVSSWLARNQLPLTSAWPSHRGFPDWGLDLVSSSQIPVIEILQYPKWSSAAAPETHSAPAGLGSSMRTSQLIYGIVSW